MLRLSRRFQRTTCALSQMAGAFRFAAEVANVGCMSEQTDSIEPTEPAAPQADGKVAAPGWYPVGGMHGPSGERRHRQQVGHVR